MTVTLRWHANLLPSTKVFSLFGLLALALHAERAVVAAAAAAALATTTPPPEGASRKPRSRQHGDVSRREALLVAAGGTLATASAAIAPSPAAAADAALAADPETVDMAAFGEVLSRARSGGPPGRSSSKSSIVRMTDPPPLLPIRAAGGDKSIIKIPRVGYSLYKTSPDQASRATALALRAGITHFDVATAYDSNGQVGAALAGYLNVGMGGLDLAGENAEVLGALDAARMEGELHASTSTSANSGVTFRTTLAPPPDGSAGRRGRRDRLFVSHKVSNAEQSTSASSVRRAVRAEIAKLGVGYLDLVSVHSPLTDGDRRLATYGALLDLRDSGFVRSVGVCNYGVGPLGEIEGAGLEPPSVNQLELSPFNRHRDAVDWCDRRGVAVGCAAWSKLSSADGPQDGWAVVADIAKKRRGGVTKAQVLVRWALQSGYVSVPRSGCGSKIERVAIAENSYGGVNHTPTGAGAGAGGFVLTGEEMAALDGLDEGLRAGKLGRRDGWDDEDVTGPEWDPTDFV